jgi:hypothetical protein
MNPKKLQQLARDPRFISGIYNYCDRWCERCPFSKRCLNFAIEQEENFPSGDERDLHNNEFWEHLHTMFQQTIEMVKEGARERGVDLDDPDLQAETLAYERQLCRREIKNQRLPKAAMVYLEKANKWMEAAKPDFKAKGIELETEEKLEIGKPRKELAAIEDFVEVIRWYQHFIYVKLSRAISSRAEEQMETDPGMRAFPKDSDGTAKVALIAIDRSIGAWAGLRGVFPGQEDSILELLRQLGQIRQQAEAMFPNARKFVRPGFDDPVK